MDECPDCAAARGGLWHGFHANCEGCQARMVSRSPQCFEARKAGKLTPAYRELLATTGLTHLQVKEWDK